MPNPCARPIIGTEFMEVGGRFLGVYCVMLAIHPFARAI
jgi:hypothetical protein